MNDVPENDNEVNVKHQSRLLWRWLRAKCHKLSAMLLGKASIIQKQAKDKAPVVRDRTKLTAKELSVKTKELTAGLRARSSEFMDKHAVREKAHFAQKEAREKAVVLREEVKTLSNKFKDEYIEGTKLDPYIEKVDETFSFLSNKNDFEHENEAVQIASGPIRFGLWLFLLIFLFGGLWAACVPISSAAIATGTVVLDANKKTIQHKDGGYIAQILVREGDIVDSGQALVRLDDVEARASVEILTSQLFQVRAAEARLVAERDSLERVIFDRDVLEAQDDPEIEKIVDAQKRLFESRRDTMQGQVSILKQRIKQLGDEIEGLEAQEQAATAQLELIEEEISVVRKLVEKGNAVKPRLLSLQRKSAELSGNRGEFLSQIARAGQSITENELSIIKLRDEHQAEVVTQLREVQEKMADIEERLGAAKEVLQRIDIVAPQSGKVTGLNFHTIGGVITPGAEIMNIVPLDDELVIEANVMPQDIDVVHEGLEAQVRLSAYKARKVPMLKGNVEYVSADRFINEYTGEPYYKAHVSISQETLDELVDESIKLYPGMPAEVHIYIGEKTPLSYMLDPISDHFGKAFKEQ